MMRRKTGILGEKIACDFLAKNGYQIIATNYRCREGEMDIISKQQDALVFIEVRTKKGRTFGSPEESITDKKKEKLRQVAGHYLQDLDSLPAAWRIDIIAIEMDGRGKATRIEIIENAVEDAD